ncbi:Ger(x)C family spore germination protein [Paenibacillus sp. GCM10023248]|uniref:Ger(x)C family spore germination protein n=1 Tax=Bacillales TaxID=1385 RepID=UPI002378CB78|nr:MULTISPECIES: Ger(x)C family spore germination protein [Bacillales]MDD9271928.1 Ger(x)C family spore germination protein [Paenibacillus sp. MAHUQ-63]MDR6879549.1 spore germination protein KC [Bacillus sp. 3255]
MKRWLALLILIPLLTLSGGCWDRTELNDMALITALAFDKGDNNQIKTTIQFIMPQNLSAGGAMGGGGGSGGAQKRTTVRSEQGYDVADALSKLQRKMPRKLFWGQCKVFIFSDAVAKEGIRQHFDFLTRHPQPRERANMYVSKGKASEALELFPFIERSSAEVLRELSDLQIGIKVTMEQLSMMLKADSQGAALPLVSILPTLKSAEPFQTIPYIFGTAVFKNDKMVGELSEKATRGVLWVKNEIKEYTVTYKTKEAEGLVSLNPVKANIKLIPQIIGDQWTMVIKIKTEGDMVQNGTSLDPMNPDFMTILDKAFGDDVRERIEYSIYELQQRLKVDILDFAKEFHRKYPKEWSKAKDRWDELFPQVQTKIEVEAHIIRPGLINTQGGIPKEEAKEK